MSPVKASNIEITNRNPGNVMTGATTMVRMDGIPVKLCKSIKFEANAKGLALVTMELYADVKVQSDRVATRVIPV